MRSTASLETARATPAMIEHNEIRRDCKGSPQCSRSLHQPNVGLSCEPREQAERRASDALRSVGVRQIQARVGLCLGPNLRSRSRKCRGKPRELTIRVARARCREDPCGAVRRLRSFRGGGVHRELGEGERLQVLAARRCSERRRSSQRRPPGAASRTRNSPGFLAHDVPPWSRMVSSVCSRSTGVFKKVAPAGTALLGGGAARTRSTAFVEPLARRWQRALKPLGQGIQRSSSRPRADHD